MNEFSIAGLNLADCAIIGIIVLSALISLIRGFVREAISLATWIIAIIIAIKFAPVLSTYFENYIQTPSFRIAAAFLIIFFVLLLIGSLINYLISTLVSKTGLSGTDRLLGLIFGFARGILFIGVIVMLANMTSVPKENWFQKSQLIPHFQGLSEWLKGFVPEQMQKIGSVDKITTGDDTNKLKATGKNQTTDKAQTQPAQD